MQIVSDRGVDLAPEQLAGLDVHFVPLRVTLGERTYASGEDLDSATFYRLLSESDDYPTTSQPSAGDLAALYRRLAETDPDILSIHISSGLSGTVQSARLAASMVPEANVTIVDTKTLSVPAGWQLQFAAVALKAGWPLEAVLAKLDQIRLVSEAFFTLSTLKYLIHGGRISHLRGLVASMLNIKPIISVEKEYGKYIDRAKEVTFRRAIQKIADTVATVYPQGSTLRVQLMHGDNLEGVEILRERMSRMFDCVFEPVTVIAPALGAHTGPALVALAVAPVSLFVEPNLPPLW